ncbi:MAG: hypothetical protein HGB11_04835 [Chlorobiales bacterium]|jgi:hypothetical protein|nr:hypothetical protein [Chlorobiales bacterium]
MNDDEIILLMAVIFIGLCMLLFGLWIWSIIHCATNKNISDNSKLIGILLIVFLGILGSFIYLFISKDGNKQSGFD